MQRWESAGAACFWYSVLILLYGWQVDLGWESCHETTNQSCDGVESSYGTLQWGLCIPVVLLYLCCWSKLFPGSFIHSLIYELFSPHLSYFNAFHRKHSTVLKIYKKLILSASIACGATAYFSLIQLHGSLKSINDTSMSHTVGLGDMFFIMMNMGSVIWVIPTYIVNNQQCTKEELIHQINSCQINFLETKELNCVMH